MIFQVAFSNLNILYIVFIGDIQYKASMKRDERFFLHPKNDWQRRYEALRASYVDRLPAKAVAERFGYSTSYVNLLRHQFAHGKIDFNEPFPEGKVKRRAVNEMLRKRICQWRKQNLSAGEIAQILSEQGVEISLRTVERILAEEGFPKLPRRTQLKIGRTVKGAEVAPGSETIKVSELGKMNYLCDGAGVFLFAPFLERFKITKIIKDARLPGTKVIPSISYFLSFLSLKLLGTERFAHINEHAFDHGLGMFAALNVLPKVTAMSTYSFSLDPAHLLRLQQAFVRQAAKLGLYATDIINLDFHTVPHFGDDSVLEKHWAGARHKVMKGALTLFAQDACSKLILYTAADIQRDEADEQVMHFLSFWKKIRRGLKPTFVFDSKFTTYGKLSQLNQQGVRFITLRRRGKNMVDQIKHIKKWNKIHIPHAKRKYPNPLVHESFITINDYEGELRQVIMKGNGHEKPAFLISNDFQTPLELLVGNYSRRWRVENVISEAVKFFNLNALSSPILVKVHFDVVMTMIADTLYSMLAHKLRGFEDCDASKIHRLFVKGKAKITIQDRKITVTYSKKAHNPILRAVPWHRLPTTVSWLQGADLELIFK